MAENELTATEIAKQDSSIAVFGEVALSPEWLKAATALTDGKIPPENVRSHPGKGGKIFHYIDHVWVTQQLRTYFGPYWSMSSGQWEVFSDGSVSMPVTLKIFLPGQPTYEITQVGSFDANTKMSMSNRVASAESRGLVRCVWRLFGLGDEFYKGSQEQMTPEEAWAILRNYVEKNKGDLDAYVEILKNMGVTRETLVDNDVFECAYEMAYDICNVAKKPANVPLDKDEVQNEPEPKPEPEQAVPDPEEPEEPKVQPEPAPEPEDALPPSEEVVTVEAVEVTEEPEVIKPSEPLVDINFKPAPTKEGWIALAKRLDNAGVHEDTVKSEMRKKFGVWEARSNQKYWDYLAAELNAGRLPLNGDKLPPIEE